MNRAIVGIDVSKDDFHVCFKVREDSKKASLRGAVSLKTLKKVLGN